jgi:hypothetical protein
MPTARDTLALRQIATWYSDRAAVPVLLAVALATVLALAFRFDPGLIMPDTIQLMDAAHHLLAGEGYSTSIIYYETQQQFASIPAPLTVWPPGLSWLFAGVMAFGFAAPRAAFIVALLSHLVVTALIYVGLRRVAVPTWIASIAALVWLLDASICSLVLACTSEPAFIACTLASCMLLVEAMRRPVGSTKWLLGAGACAAYAILVRYNGVLWPAAAGLWFLVLAVRERSWRPLLRAIVFGSLPALTLLTLFWRNLQLTGRLSGGQFEFGGAGDIAHVVRTVYWESHLLFGSLVTSYPAVLALVAALFVFGVVIAARRLTFMQPRATLLALAVLNFAVVAVFLLGNGILSSMVFIEYRYWIPTLPFLIVSLAIVVDEAIAKLRSPGAAVALLQPAALVVLVAVFLAVSLLIEFPRRWTTLAPVHPATIAIDHALAERLPDGRTLRDALTAGADPHKPVLALFEHRFSRATGRAVLGLADARYTHRTWTADETAKLVKERGITEVIFFPTVFDPTLAMNANMEIYKELYAGMPPDWLRPRYVSPTVQLYEVVVPKRQARLTP